MPVIYLYQPNPMRVTVPLSPFPEWQFSDVYPAVNAAKERNAQRLEWVVHARRNGIPVDGERGSMVSHWGWEPE